MSLLPHQERVVAEREDLFDKVVKLRVFLQSAFFETINPEERGRLKAQYVYMDLYLEVLDKRIAAF